MAQQTIGIGTAANDGTGDTLRDAFDKCNDNFTELYGVGSGGITRIATSTPSGTGVVTFSSIANTYKQLRVVIFGRGSQAATNTAINITFNNDTGANYDYQYSQGAGTGTATLTLTAGDTKINGPAIAAASATANVASSFLIEIPGYANTTFEKAGTWVGSLKTNTTTGFFFRDGQFFWRSTSAINRIDLTLASGNWVAGSEVHLYGIS